MIFDALSNTACRYVVQEPSYRGAINDPPPHQVVENLEAQQGAG